MVFGNLSTGYWLGAASAGLHWQELGRTTLGSAADSIDVFSNEDNTITLSDDFSSDNFTNVGGQSGWGVSGGTMAWTTARNTTNQGEYRALPSTVTGDFVLRFKLTNTTIAYDGSQEEYLFIGLSNSTSCNSTTNQNVAGMYFHNYSTGDSKIQVTYRTNTGPFSGTATSIDFGENTTYYVEISKSDDTVTLKLFSDSGYSTLMSGGSATSTGGAATDTYTHIVLMGMNHSNAGSTSALGTIDDIKFYNGVSSVKKDLTAKPYLMVLGHTLNSGSTNIFSRNNGDSGSNYAENGSINGGTNYTQTSQAQLDLSGGGESKPMFVVQNIMNISDQEKLIINHTNNCATGATNAPNRIELAGKWANTSASTSSISFNNTSSGSYDTGSEVVVLGYDPDDTEGGSVWEELADVTLGSAGDTITTSTFTAKKYLMVQTNCIASGGDIRTQVVFNNDTGSNYAFRSSHNGGSDSTDTSQASLKWTNTSGSDSQELHTMFIVNVAAKEKLVISDGIIQATAGAGNVPGRRENVGKWINTSNQITRVDITNGGAGDFDTGSSIKVWGFD